MPQIRLPESRLHSLDLDHRDLADLAPKVAFAKGSTIGTQDAPCDRVYLIAGGQVMLTRRRMDGGEYPLYLLGRGQLFGEGALRPERQWMVTARAVTDGSAHVLPVGQLARFAQFYPKLMEQVLEMLGERLERAHRRLDLMTSSTARQRLYGMLCVLADYHGEERGDEIWLPVRLTHAELGGMIGIARETVARALHDLEQEGLIRRRGRRGILLQSRQLLSAISLLLPCLPAL